MEYTNKDFDDALLALLKSEEARRAREKVMPIHATKIKLMKAIAEGLNRLCASGAIEMGETINDKYVKIKRK